MENDDDHGEEDLLIRILFEGIDRMQRTAIECSLALIEIGTRVVDPED